MTTNYQTHDNVAVLTLDNPPVNGLGMATRVALVAGLERALADPGIVAIVIAGAGKSFCGGADIREFGKPSALAEPNLLTLIDAFEAASKPVIVAIHGVCMGGGLELALGCHHRIAARGTQVALPEVKIGLVPGAGGTQRLPRAIGFEPALNMIVSGNPVAAEVLAAIPGQLLFDQVVDGDPVAAASPSPVPAPPRARRCRGCARSGPCTTMSTPSVPGRAPRCCRVTRRRCAASSASRLQSPNHSTPASSSSAALLPN